MIRCLVVDDSPTFRGILRHVLGSAPDVQVIGEAIDGDEAVARTLELRPDVVTMDVLMPRRGGLDAIAEIMRRAPTPIVVVSAAAGDVRGVSFEALRLGAIEVLDKPRARDGREFERQAEAIRLAVRAVAGLRLATRRAKNQTAAGPDRGARSAQPSRAGPRPADTATPCAARPPASLAAWTTPHVLGIAASTGGPAALARVLSRLPRDFPVPVLVVQHIADGFEAGLARWLAEETRLRVKVAEDGEPLERATVYVGPNGRHLAVTSSLVRLDGGAPIGGFRPSATALFESLASAFGADAAGLVLSGMGDDGVSGLKRLREQGGFTAAQGPASSAVYGMPRRAVETGAAAVMLELDDIPETLLRLVGRAPQPRSS